MIYKSGKDWLESDRKMVMLFGMSGVGKTFVSNMLRNSGEWYHYSVDYRIGTRYLGEHIVDNFKLEAMKNDFLAKLLKSDSIYIGSNIAFNNLDPLSTYIGKLGKVEKGGLPLAEFRRRQAIHHKGEIESLRDVEHFIKRASELYGYESFVCDTGGSICEVLNPFNPNDSLMNFLAGCMLPIWIESTEDLNEELVTRFIQKPKPMYYRPDFLDANLGGLQVEELDPDDFSRTMYRKLINQRIPRYEAMAANWGISINCHVVKKLHDAGQFIDLIAEELDKKLGNDRKSPCQ